MTYCKIYIIPFLNDDFSLSKNAFNRSRAIHCASYIFYSSLRLLHFLLFVVAQFIVPLTFFIVRSRAIHCASYIFYCS